MGAGKRRVDISFDRERDALRAIASAVARVSGLPIPVPVAPPATPASPPPAGSAAPPASETELTRFARELQARSEAIARTADGSERTARPRTPSGRPIERRAVPRHGGPAAASAETPGPMPERRDSERRGSERGGTTWSPVADRRLGDVAPPPPAAPTEARSTAEPTKTLRLHLSATDAPGAAPEPPDAAASAAPAAPAGPPPPATDRGGHPNAARYLGSLVAAYGPLDPAAESDAAWPLVDLLVIDASALAALARGNAQARAHLSRAVGALARIVVPSTALVDAAHARVAHAIAEIESVDAAGANLAARLIAQTSRVFPSTAFAVAAASHGPSAAVLTADVASATAYTRALGRPGLYVFAV